MHTEDRQTILFLSGSSIVAAVFLAVLAAVSALIRPGLILYMPPAAAIWHDLLVLVMAAVAAAQAGVWLSAAAGLPRRRIIRCLLYMYLRGLFYLVRAASRVLRCEGAAGRAYIQFMNQLVLRRPPRLLPQQLLVLAPHCLQWDQCPHKITRNIQNCRQCGRCTIGSIAALSQERGFLFAVVPGGTLARQLVASCRPKAVVAIACERDLISGMQDVAPLPAVGLLNCRPNGPCFNTDVNMPALKRLLSAMIGENR